MLFCDADGRISSEAPQVSFMDHGFLFGDSIYEVVRVYDRKIFGWAEHRERLIESCKRIWIPVEPMLPQIEDRMQRLLKTLQEPHSALRMIITRGVGPLNINTRKVEQPRLYMAAWKYDPTLFNKPVTIAVPEVRRNPRSALDPSIKSGNYLNSVMALRQAQDLGFDDAVMLNPEGKVTELTTSNLGWFRGSTLCTPHTDSGILFGITRRLLCETHPVETLEYDEGALREADEIFALSTFKEVLPVSKLRLSDGTVREFKSFTKTQALATSFHQKILDRLKTEKEWF